MKKLAIIGASALQAPLICRAREKGIETHVFAWRTGDAGEKSADFFYPISIVDKEEILSVCRQVGIDGIATIASDLAAVTVGFVADALGLPGNTLTATRLATNKGAMREAFRLRGDPSPDFLVLTAMPADLPSLLGEMKTLPLPLIAKPTDRSGSRGVTEVTERAGLLPAIRAAMDVSFAGEAILERVVPGKEFSVECLTVRGRHTLLQITEKFTTGAPHFIETGHMEPAGLSAEMVRRVRDVVFHALDSLEIKTGASHSELRIAHDGSIGLIEIGPRMGGDFIGSHLVPMTCGVDFVGAVIELALGGEVRPAPAPTGKAAAVRYILTPKDREAFLRLKAARPDLIAEAGVGEVPSAAVTNSADRYGWYILTADSREELLALGVM